MEIGPFIKLHRVKQNMTQEELAEGIVSESYLSKIENRRTEPSTDVINMLCTKLGVEVKSEDDSLLKEKCQEWFDMLFEVNSKTEITNKYEELQEIIENNYSHTQVLFEIHKIRYYLIIDEVNLALKQINNLKEVSNTFDNYQLYFWLKFKGNYNSVIEEFNQAFRFYKLAEEKTNQIELSEAEVADLKYTLAVTYSKLRNTLEVIDYANQALEAYSKNYNFIRCAQCHILLGISYRRIRIYDKAIKNYNLAQHLAKLNKKDDLIQLTNINLGHLYASKGDTKQSIICFNEVLEEKNALALKDRLLAVTSLVKEYYRSRNHIEARAMVNEGNRILNEIDKERHKFFDYELRTYKYALDEEHEAFESFVIGEFIPFLKKQKNYANLVIYANMVGKHFEDKNKYKSATEYYKLANYSYEQLIRI
ncbi:helix-turn-helix domain-containing protein [Sediminibacillus albus]|uniref:Tetratricopeptide repeat-containing protein n=1 Tax=Sediminibacillus albus TaxID=407036 RepID=A0A1G9BBZ3_9BACI|nr:helix-turn-helix transcriptional regulator [Sediminibacillus albus]SDK36610.1 Tetratricopeptide repeat-containing protein [Sediminibacillus albus]